MQDGHSLGEQAVYSILWSEGKPESEPQGARLIRMGQAELVAKVRINKKSIKTNISRLIEKLSIEVADPYVSDTSRPRLFRVFSYGQILERRRAAGMEYYTKNKGVMFVTPEGKPITGVSTPDPDTTPGVDTWSGVDTGTGGWGSSLPTSRTEKTPGGRPERTAAPGAVSTPLNREEFLSKSLRKQDREEQETTTLSEDLTAIRQALARLGPVDEGATIKLLKDCRQIRPDATVDEIGFFVAEKLEVARGNPRIVNPVGLVLTTVPQAFVGASFEEFRRLREEQARLAQRRHQQEQEIERWVMEEKQRLKEIVNDWTKPEEEREKAAKHLKQYGWTV